MFISRERLSVAFDHLAWKFIKMQDDQEDVLAKRMASYESQFGKLSLYVHEALHPRLLFVLAERHPFLAHDIRLAIVRCLNSLDYVAVSGRVISSAVVKGIQDGLVAGLSHSRLGADLSRVDGHHSSVEAEYHSAL